MLEGFDLKAMGQFSADYIHVVAEAIKLAMADRDAHYGDPEFTDVPLQALLSDAYTEIRRPLIDMQKASLDARPGDPHGMQPLKGPGVFRPGVGGTTTCVVADRWGNVVSATPSANVPQEPRDGGRAGVTFGNRLRSLNTTPGHPNCIEPGKRPRITLTPTLVLKDGKPIMAISVAGGDLQVQAVRGRKRAVAFGEVNELDHGVTWRQVLTRRANSDAAHGSATPRCSPRQSRGLMDDAQHQKASRYPLFPSLAFRARVVRVLKKIVWRPFRAQIGVGAGRCRVAKFEMGHDERGTPNLARARADADARQTAVVAGHQAHFARLERSVIFRA